MSKLVIYNQNNSLYYVCEMVYKYFEPYFNVDKLEIINCNTEHVISNDNIYITFGQFNNNKSGTNVTPKKFIVYNFEQFISEKHWIDSNYISFLKKAFFVIDYSIINVQKMQEIGINAYFLPLNSMNMMIYPNISNIEKDIDVLFIGTINKRRRDVLNLITANTAINCQIVTSVYFEQSLEYFARSKIVINIHYNVEDVIFEVTRLIPALENNCLILTESGIDPYYNNVFRSVIKIINIENVEEEIKMGLLNYSNLLQDVKKNLRYIQIDNTNNIMELVRYLKNIV